MFINNFILKIIILIIINIQLNCYCIEHPPYQVSIWMKGQSNTNSTHLCNGAIIHERLILTTAECVQSKVIGTNIVNTILPTMITVVAGSLNNPAKTLIIVNVSNIEVAKDFNSTTLENDLSILNLNESLPLGTRTDIKWILLDDHHDIKNNTCFINSQSPASPVNNIQQNHPVQIFNNQNCTNLTISSRRNDICSSYVLSSGNICNKTDDDINSSSDRGTALICDSKLIGLLSNIIPLNNNEKHLNFACSNVNKLKAIYTRLALHLNWIYTKISVESMLDNDKLNHTMSPPYVASAPSPTISEIPSGINLPLPLPEHENKPSTATYSTSSASTSSAPTSSVPQSTTTRPITATTKSVVTTSTLPSTTQNSNSNNQIKKPTSNASSIKFVYFNSMFAVTLILVFSWFQKYI